MYRLSSVVSVPTRPTYWLLVSARSTAGINETTILHQRHLSFVPGHDVPIDHLNSSSCAFSAGPGSRSFPRQYCKVPDQSTRQQWNLNSSSAAAPITQKLQYMQMDPNEKLKALQEKIRREEKLVEKEGGGYSSAQYAYNCEGKANMPGGASVSSSAKITPPKQTVAPPPSKPTPPAQQNTSPPRPPLPPKRGSKGKLAALLVFTLGAGVGVVGYAAYDDDFCCTMSEQPVVGPYFAQIPSMVSGNRLCEKEADSVTKSLVPAKQLQPLKSCGCQKQCTCAEILAQDKCTSPEVRKAINEEDQARDLQRRRKEAEQKARAEKNREMAETDVQNTTLEALLKSVMEECCITTYSAIRVQKAAVEATNLHSCELRKAMDLTGKTDGVDGQWEVVAECLKKKTKAVNDAQDALKKAKREILKVCTAVEDGKQNKVTQKNKAIGETEKAVSTVKYELDSVVGQLEKAEADARIVDRYRELIKKGRAQFKKELESIAPAVSIGTPSGIMTEDDLNSLIAHAHRRIEQLQQQMSCQQSIEQKHIEEALCRKEREDQRLTNEALCREREKLCAQFECEKMDWEAQARLQFEEELRQHLTRQAAAHADHITDVLKVQERELEARFTVLLDERKMEERNKMYAELSDYIARLKGIEAAVDARADKEKQIQKAQELWLACQNLQLYLAKGGAPESKEWGECQLKPLKEELQAIEAAAVDNPTVYVLLSSIPKEAWCRGVWTMEGLRKRFDKVSKVAKRVAMIPESGGTVFQYAASYVRYMLTFSGPKTITDCTEDTIVNIEELNTFTIMDMAEKLLQEGKLDAALRLMNQLRGQSRFVACDWIKEARIYLETQQAANVISAFACSRSIGGLD